MDLRWLSPGDEDALVAASPLFDDAVSADGARRFLAAPGHHLCVAYLDGRPAGFVSGVQMTHPDKGVEMFLYELGVDEEFRRRGIGAALSAALADRARDLGCYGMWVLTDHDNEAALRTYRAAGAGAPEPAVMLEWQILPS
ncbi:ribosomal protein S18 acetylase RimI-like enzyme [Catenuloplanes nepalensis]|uniref:Ribosomal protein S18 acetylase RimI-like enzyme n=1 Tax=Catenuloplanes nepalensis TaxID=587533 RepID=A0ABT9MVZ0_9ACTN|nr:GNAT family N-acetyltransferase [Catenuloplanes nepalensis]MDP9795613.1 ribosomal protein S18 acetylase RimI-like enzyme [Catenuloplanes nepalensis]